MKHHSKGLTLVEVLTASLILSLIAIPVLTIFLQSKNNIVRTDSRRKYFHYAREIVSRAERASLHVLWNYYGPKGYNVPGGLKDPDRPAFGTIAAFGASGRFRDRLAEYDPVTKKLTPGNPALHGSDVNPLGFSEDFLDEMAMEGFEGQLSFEFFPRKALGIADTPPGVIGKPHADIGILHMQAGYANVRLVDIKNRQVLYEEMNTIMCPAVVGRPGLKLSSCPAISKGVNLIYAPILKLREADLPL
jgi:hypothetical protein